MKEILSFCEAVGFCDAYRDAYLDAYRVLSEAGREHVLLAAVDAFLANEELPIVNAAAPLEVLSATCSVPLYTLHGLFVIKAFLMGREAFVARLGEEIYRDTSADILCKTAECVARYDVVGTSSLPWYEGLLRGQTIGIGRLQYRLVKFRPESYERHGLTLKHGDPVVTIHIPSSGPLTAELCLDSYRRAYAHFSSNFSGGVVPFVCHSWMLYERNREFFPDGGNLMRFMGDFEILENTEGDSENLWRIYGKQYDDPSLLPRKTRLQASLADYLTAGNKMGIGYGVFAHDGQKILK